MIEQRNDGRFVEELGGKGELLVLAQPLVAKDEHGVTVHCRVYIADGRGVDGLAQVDTVGARGEERMQRRKRCGHRVSLRRRRAA